MGLIRNIIDLFLTIVVVDLILGHAKETGDKLDTLGEIKIIGPIIKQVFGRIAGALGDFYENQKCFTYLVVYLLVHSIPLPFL